MADGDTLSTCQLGGSNVTHCVGESRLFLQKKSNTVIFAISQFKNVVLKKIVSRDLTRPDLTLRKRKKKQA
jgi:hypothetical protein